MWSGLKICIDKFGFLIYNTKYPLTDMRDINGRVVNAPLTDMRDISGRVVSGLER